MICEINWFLGISSFVNKNTSCKPENLLLREVQKYIIIDKHQRQLCRTKITVSINSRNYKKVIEDLKYGCQHLDGNSTIFFQCKIFFCLVWINKNQSCFEIKKINNREMFCFFSDCYVNSFPEHFNTTTGGKILKY